WAIAGAVGLGAAMLATWFGASWFQRYQRELRDHELVAKERQWNEYQQTRSKEQFEKLLTDGPSNWPMPAEETFAFQNGLHDLQVRKNRASLRNDAAEIEAIDAEIKRAEPLLRRLQTELSQSELLGLQLPAVHAARSAANRAKSLNNLKQLSL